MSAVATSFYDMSPYWNSILELQRRMAEISKPLNALMPTYLETIPQISDAVGLSAPVLSIYNENVQNIVNLAGITAKIAPICNPAVLQSMQIEQNILSQIAPLSEIQSSTSYTYPRVLHIPHLGSCEPAKWAYQRSLEIYRIANFINRASIDFDANDAENTSNTIELSGDDQKVIAAELNEILSTPQNWEQRFMASINKFKNTHPVVASILKFLLINILSSVIINLATSAIGQTLNRSRVYQEPKNSSQIICCVEPHQSINIVSEVPYYYQIEIQDSSHSIITGYISKRNVAIFEENGVDFPEDFEDNNEEE